MLQEVSRHSADGIIKGYRGDHDRHEISFRKLSFAAIDTHIDSRSLAPDVRPGRLRAKDRDRKPNTAPLALRQLDAFRYDSQQKGKAHMNTNTRSRIYLPMASMILTAALAVGAAPQKQVPFTGLFQGHETDILQGPPGTLVVHGNGTGIATQIGQFTVTWQATVDLSNGSATGSFAFTATNGDIIFATDSGQAEPTDSGLTRIVEINTITGGTGRFAGAKGTFTVERLLDSATGFTAGAFHGTITSSGSAH
jgi:hypothetical protein